MRRMAVPLVAGLIVIFISGSALGQVVAANEYLGFKDTIRALPCSTVTLPIYVKNDSVITAISMNFTFNPFILHPQLVYDAAYDQLVDPPDSSEWTGNGDAGLWYIDVSLSAAAAATWDVDKGPVLAPYKLKAAHGTADTARFLLIPTPFVTPPLPHIPKGSAMRVAYLKFKVDSLATINTSSPIRVIDQTSDWQLSEFSEEYISGDTSEVSITPTLYSSIFVVDTPGAPPVDSNVNKIPNLAAITPNVYSVNQGQTVAFTVSATDAEGGTLKIYANRTGSLPRNATFGTSGVVTGSGGIASGSFSFTPDMTQQGNFVFTFEAYDDSGAYSTAQVVTVTVAELEVDVLFTTSAEGQSPQGGVPGLDAVMVPINVVTKKTVYGIQFDMIYNADYFTLDSIIPTDRIPAWVAYDNVGQSPGNLRVVAFGLANDEMVDGSTSAVMNLAFTVGDYATAGCYPLEFSRAWESIDPDPEIPAFELDVQSGILCVDLWGDINFNGFVDVDDAVGVVRYIIGDGELNRRRLAAGDIVRNDTVNVVDLVGIVYAIFGWPLPSNPTPVVPDDQFATLKVNHGEIPDIGMQSEMAISADLPTEAAGIELTIAYNPETVQMLPPQLVDGVSGFSVNYRDNGNGTMRVVLHSWTPWNDAKLIAEGISDVLTLPFVSKAPISADDDRVVRITKAVISDGAARNVPVGSTGPEPLPSLFELAQNRPNPFNPTTTIDFYIESQSDVRLEVFNVLGQLVKTLVDRSMAPGQYSVVWDGTDTNGARMASGVYLYRLKSGDASLTKKMGLLK
jgi:hypothetical protein